MTRVLLDSLGVPMEPQRLGNSNNHCVAPFLFTPATKQENYSIKARHTYACIPSEQCLNNYSGPGMAPAATALLLAQNCIVAGA